MPHTAQEKCETASQDYAYEDKLSNALEISASTPSAIYVRLPDGKDGIANNYGLQIELYSLDSVRAHVHINSLSFSLKKEADVRAPALRHSD